jgi:hypothetical protein
MGIRDRDAASSIHAGCCGDNVKKSQGFVFIKTFALPTTAPSTAAAKDHGHRHQKKTALEAVFLMTQRRAQISGMYSRGIAT